jgi:multicomponent Na+:H+ antiporter subunit C
VETLLAFVIGGLVTAGVYLILSRNLVRLIIGVALLSNAVNLTLFTSGRLTRANPPIIPADMDVPEGVFANPLPQALILTAIVIGFGLLAFTLVLVYRASQELGTVDPDEMRLAEPPFEEALEQGSVAQDPVKQGVSG